MLRLVAWIPACTALSLTSLACTSDGDGGGGKGSGGAAASSGGAAAGAGGAEVSAGGASTGGGTSSGGRGDGGPLDAGPSDCSRIEAACAVVDPGTGLTHTCHEVGRAGDPTACAEELESCEALCGARLCNRLGSLCHPITVGIGPECHDLGHAGDAEVCFERGPECSAFCASAAGDGGTGHPDGGSHEGGSHPDASTEGGPGDGSTGDGGGVEGGVSSCARIAEACREIDPGSGAVHECALLDLADAGTCAARHEECRALCGPTLCVRLRNVCHDPGEALGGDYADCHELGHAGAAGPCFDRATECLALCRTAS